MKNQKNKTTTKTKQTTAANTTKNPPKDTHKTKQNKR